MKIVIFGLTVSSSWGNGHATLWRGLCAGLGRRGHKIVFFERDTPYYAQHRDLNELPGGELLLYSSWNDVRAVAARALSDADVATVTSYCPDGIAATELALDSAAALRVFYDLDTPVTLHRLACGEAIEAIGPDGLANFDLVLSYTGGSALDELRTRLGARAVAPLYGGVDPAVHQPVPVEDRFRGDLGYLGTHAPDRDAALRDLFVELARRLPHLRFLMAGSKYDGGFPWQPNIFFMGHLAPADHAAFYCSTRITLNVTRQAMKKTGYCPSGRLFEAAACGAAMLSDWWEGIDKFFEPGREILIANSTEDALAALDRSPEDLARIGRAARQRALAEHTAAARAMEMERILENAANPRSRYATEAI